MLRVICDHRVFNTSTLVTFPTVGPSPSRLQADPKDPSFGVPSAFRSLSVSSKLDEVFFWPCSAFFQWLPRLKFLLRNSLLQSKLAAVQQIDFPKCIINH